MKTALYATLLAMLISIPSLTSAQVYTPKGPIEAKYQADGPWAVSQSVSATPCDRENRVCDIIYPTNLGTNPIKGQTTGFRHPVISWANGTGQTAEKYNYFLRHLASWGFIIVASRDDGTGTGGTTVDAANYIIAQGAAANSAFHGKVDETNVGVAGHSQGGSTVIALLAKKTAPFKAYIEIHAPPEIFALLCCGVTKSSLSSSGATGAILHMGGTIDPPDVQTGWYTATPSSAVKALGIQLGTNHDDIMGDPACKPSTNCAKGVYGYLGYATAWFMWRLQNATDGSVAFSSASGEFGLPDNDWNDNRSNIP